MLIPTTESVRLLATPRSKNLCHIFLQYILKKESKETSHASDSSCRV